MTRSTKNAVAAPVVLKTLHDDILRANPSSTLTTKKMRVVLRAKMNDVHARNSSWVFNPTDYDRARSLFDPAYAQKLERASKRATKPAVMSRASKTNTPAVADATPVDAE